jgi:DNA helicase-2/ATP-dependent DNA helicase PcrA
MTRSETKLYLSWARYRRRFGGGQPEVSLASRFLNEVPRSLVDAVRGDQPQARSVDLYSERYQVRESAQRNLYTGKTYNSVDNIRQFFSERGMPAPQGIAPPAASSAAPAAATTAAQPAAPVPQFKKVGPKKLGPGSTVEHTKWGRGTVLRLEGSGDDTKVTVSFPGYGLKKLIAKYAGIKVE